MLQPPLPLQSFLPAQSLASVLQPPLPLQSFLPRQHSLWPADAEPEGACAGFALSLVGSACVFSAQPETRPATASDASDVKAAVVGVLRMAVLITCGRI